MAERVIAHEFISQDKEDPRHTLGCSPEGFPTQKFIEDFSGESLSLSVSFSRPVTIR
jgi:hypothetical protein